VTSTVGLTTVSGCQIWCHLNIIWYLCFI